MEFVKKNIKWFGLGGCVLAIISLFLPYATASAKIFGTTVSESVTYISGDGKIALFLIIAAGALIFFKKEKIALIPLALCVALNIFTAINVNETDIGAMSSIVKVNFGLGFYLLFVSLAITIAAIVYNNFVLKKNTSSTNNVSQPEMQQPVQPAMVQPEMQQPVQPTMTQPEMQQPVQPAMVQPEMQQPVQPAMVQSEMQQPVQPTMVQPQMQQPVQPTMVQPQMQQPNVVTTCPVCGNTVQAGMQICNHCGNKVS